MSIARQVTELVYNLRSYNNYWLVGNNDLLVERYTLTEPWGCIVLDATYSQSKQGMVLDSVQIGADENGKVRNRPEVDIAVNKSNGMLTWASYDCNRVYSERGYIRASVFEKLKSRIEQPPDQCWQLSGGQLDYADDEGLRPAVNLLHKNPIQLPVGYPTAILRLQKRIAALSEGARNTLAAIVTGEHTRYLLLTYEEGTGTDLAIIESKNYKNLEDALRLLSFHNKNFISTEIVPLLISDNTNLLAFTHSLPAEYADPHGVDTRAGEPAILAFQANDEKPRYVSAATEAITKWLLSRQQHEIFAGDVVIAVGVKLSNVDTNVYKVSVDMLTKVLKQFKGQVPTLVVAKMWSKEHTALSLLGLVRDDLIVASADSNTCDDEHAYNRSMQVITSYLANGRCERVVVVRELMFDGAQLLDL